MQTDLFSKKKQIWSCCHCSWEGTIKDREEEICPKCGWAIWEIEKAKNMTETYSAFKKKYG